jgi:glutathione S-transferase
MKLYSFPVAPNPTRLAIYLGEKGIVLETEMVNLRAGQQRSEAHLARHPLGKLPVLELDDGSFLTESTSIIEYLEELHPEPSMIGTTPLERARVRELDRIADIGVLIAFAKTVHATNSPLGLPANPQAATAYMADVPRVLEILDQRLADHTFLGGDRPCIADCTLRAGYGFAEFGKIEIPSGYTQIDRWRSDMDARPSAPHGP